MIESFLSVFKEGSELKGAISALQHIESIVVNVLGVHTDNHDSSNKAIDAICQILQSFKSDSSKTVSDTQSTNQ